MAESSRPEEPVVRRNRLAIHGVLIAIDAPDVSAHPWVVDAIDISSSGMGLVLPPEIEEGRRVLLSFELDDTTRFSRVPALVRHQMTQSGGVEFKQWPSAERLKLLEYLVRWYETLN